jgi:hemerythrin-like domain-containing protein
LADAAELDGPDCHRVAVQAHLDKENNVLFVMAKQILMPDEQRGLVEGFEP